MNQNKFNPQQFIMKKILLYHQKYKMSKYKMPILIQGDIKKDLHKKFQRYKLPIKKDQPSPEIQYSIDQFKNHIIKIPKIKRSQLYHNTSVNLSKTNLINCNNLQIEPIRKSAINLREEINLTKRKQKHIQINHHQIISQDLSHDKDDNLKQKYQNDEQLSNLIKNSSNDILLKNQKLDIKILQKLPIIKERNQKMTKKKDNLFLWQELLKQLSRYGKNGKKIKYNKRLSKNQLKQQKEFKNQEQEKQLEKSRRKIENYLAIRQIPSKLNLSVDSKHDNFVTKRKQMTQEQSSQKLKILSANNKTPNKIKSRYKQLKTSISFYIDYYEQIKNINPFFRKINRLGACILLNLGTIFLLQSGKKLYNEGEVFTDLYILNYGKVILTNKYTKDKKIVLTGETLGQESLFESDKSYNQRLKTGQKMHIHKQYAKVISNSCFLSVNLKKYYQLSRQLSKAGHKQLFNLIDNLFRINYLNKQKSMNLNKIRNNTEV